MSAQRTPLATVSLDLDDLWSYLRTAQRPGWQSRPSHLPTFVPRMLDLLDELRLRITFFIVGADAARAENRTLLAELARRGHEIGNHSHEHEPWLQRYARADLEREVEASERAIEGATGVRPVGFRGPGFSWSPALLELLAERGYVYDASTFPTFLGPLARAYYFAATRLTRSAGSERDALFGTLADGLRPIRPYRWRLESNRTLLEIPVTTLPLLRTPIHPTYLMYLAQQSERVMHAYLGAALAALDRAGIEPSILLHPTDLLSAEHVPELGFFPGMRIEATRKERLLREVLRRLTERFDVVPMGVYAEHIAARGTIPERPARAANASRASLAIPSVA